MIVFIDSMLTSPYLCFTMLVMISEVKYEH